MVPRHNLENMDLGKEISHQIELHSVEGIKACFENGLDPNAYFEGKHLFNLLVSMYTRSPRFKDCVRLFIEFGLEFENKALLAVLADDPSELQKHLSENPEIIEEKITLSCAYTPLKKVSLLHVCAEFNHVNSAWILVTHGLNVNCEAGIDENGFGGQTPVYHTVNQNNNNSAEMMDFLLLNGANLSHTIKGLIWGENFPWETFLPALNPISYATMGLLPQMHRNEKVIFNTINKLMKHEYGIDYRPKNIPNKYL